MRAWLAGTALLLVAAAPGEQWVLRGEMATSDSDTLDGAAVDERQVWTLSRRVDGSRLEQWTITGTGGDLELQDSVFLGDASGTDSPMMAAGETFIYTANSTHVVSYKKGSATLTEASSYRVGEGSTVQALAASGSVAVGLDGVVDVLGPDLRFLGRYPVGQEMASALAVAGSSLIAIAHLAGVSLVNISGVGSGRQPALYGTMATGSTPTSLAVLPSERSGVVYAATAAGVEELDFTNKTSELVVSGRSGFVATNGELVAAVTDGDSISSWHLGSLGQKTLLPSTNGNYTSVAVSPQGFIAVSGSRSVGVYLPASATIPVSETPTAINDDNSGVSPTLVVLGVIGSLGMVVVIGTAFHVTRKRKLREHDLHLQEQGDLGKVYGSLAMDME